MTETAPSEHIELALTRMEWSRSILLDDLSNVDRGAVDWQPTKSTDTIATSILHIAGFEYILALELHHDKGTLPDPELWSIVKHGFRRNLDLDQIKGEGIEFYTKTLNRTRKLCVDAIKSVGSDKLQSAGEPFSRALSMTDLTPDQQKTMMGMARAKMTPGVFMAMALSDHEHYHRGQITLNNFLFKQQA